MAHEHGLTLLSEKYLSAIGALFIYGKIPWGEITLGINSGLASSILANVLPKFNLEHPEISVKLLENNQNISEHHKPFGKWMDSEMWMEKFLC